MGQTTDQLRSELDRKRAELSDDVDRIEHKVRSAFDVRQQVADKPLQMTGLAIAAGFLLGNIVGGRREEKQPQRYGHGYSMSGMGSAAYSPTSAGATGSIYDREPSRQMPAQHHDGPNFFSSVGEGVKEGFRRGARGNSIEATVSHLSAAMLAMLLDKAKDALDSNLPGFAEKYEQISRTSSTSGPATTGYGNPATASYSGEYASSRPDQPMTGAGGSATYGSTAPRTSGAEPSSMPPSTPRTPGH